MPYTTYDYYTKDFFGDVIPEKSFLKYEGKARFIIDQFTFDRLKDKTFIPIEVENCMCDMMEYLYEQDSKEKGNGISSETTDGYSVTYQKEKSVKEKQSDLYRIARKYLSRTGLMNRMVR